MSSPACSILFSFFSIHRQIQCLTSTVLHKRQEKSNIKFALFLFHYFFL